MPKPKRRDSFRFRLGEGDDDIREFLDGLPERERSQTVKNLIRLALHQARDIAAINAKLDQILNKLTHTNPK